MILLQDIFTNYNNILLKDKKMTLQISNETKQKAKNITIYGGTGLASLIGFISIGAAIINCINPELTKPLIDLFKGEKGFALAISLFASISLALAMLGIIYIVFRHKLQDKTGPINSSNNEIIVSTIKKEGVDLIVTGEGLEKLNFNDDQAKVVTDFINGIVIQKTGHIYKIVPDDRIQSLANLKDNEEIKLNVYLPKQPGNSLSNTQVINAIAAPAICAPTLNN